jgi:DNA-binding PadR family transcriptional regulator
MRLKPGSYLILGMLNLGLRTGYAVKRTVDRSTRFFWAASLAQVYPELAALEEGGYVVSTDDPQGARPRKCYRLTEAGRAALEDAFELVKRLRIRAEELERDFRAEILPYAESASTAERRFPLIAAREGADYFAWRAGWFRKIEKELADELAGGSAA